MSEVKHTPTPWVAAHDCINDSHGRFIASSWESLEEDEVDNANAAHIVKCVNMHDELVATIESFLKVYSQPDEQICCNGRDCGCHGASIYQEAEHYAREALKKAGAL